MSPRQQVSRTAIDLVKRFEGYRRQAARLPDGRWTIGYGHTASAREGATVSEADAEALLIYDLMRVAAAMDGLVYAPLTRNQHDALCAFAFSIGPEAFRASEVLKRVNEGAFIQAAFALEMWRRAEFEGEALVIDALVRRRAAEKLLFLTPPGDAWVAAPSAVLRPQLDLVRDTAPAEPPASLVASFVGESVEVVRDERMVPTYAAEAVDLGRDSLFAGDPVEIASSEAVAAETALTDAGLPQRTTESAPGGAAPLDPSLPEPPVSADEAPPEPAAETVNGAEAPMPRIVAQDLEPYPLEVASGRRSPRSGASEPLVITVLLALGLAFFVGGLFWAFNAEPGVEGGVFTPLLVGWLAGVAGVGFLAVAAFMLLQRLGQAEGGRPRKSE